MLLQATPLKDVKFGTPAPEVFRDWSAVALLDRAKQGKFGWCGQAAMIFQQACMTVGPEMCPSQTSQTFEADAIFIIGRLELTTNHGDSAP